MTACPAVAPVAVPVKDLAWELRQQCMPMAAEIAWANNTLIVVVGQDAEGRIVLCADSCAERGDEVIAVVSEVEAVSRGYNLEPGRTCTAISRAGRTAYTWPTRSAQ